MKYTPNDFSNCVFNPLCDGKILEVYPQLNEIINPEFKAEPNLDAIVRYAICVYDPKSPLQGEKDLNHRKSTAAELSKFDMSQEDYMAQVYSGENEVVLNVITRYLVRYARSKEFAALTAMEYKYYENVSELLTPIKGETNTERLEAAKKKSLIAGELEADLNRIEMFWERLYGDKDLLKQVKKQRVTPEMIANGK